MHAHLPAHRPAHLPLPAGVVPIANDSGGPREDIVLPEPPACADDSEQPSGPPQPTGFRCSSLAQYADAIVEVVGMTQVERMQVAAAARRRAAQFSDQRFKKEFMACLEGVLPLGRGAPPPRNVLH